MMHVSIPELLSEEHSLGVFVLVSVAMGGGAAWLAGIAIARTWRPWWLLALYMLLLALAVRFIHFALFGGTLLSAHYYAVDAVVVLLIGSAGFRVTRTRQMTSQYRWLYDKTSPLTWRPR